MDIDQNTFTWQTLVKLERFALSLLKDFILDQTQTAETNADNS